MLQSSSCFGPVCWKVYYYLYPHLSLCLPFELLQRQHPVQSRLDQLVPLRVVKQLRLLYLHFFKMSHRASEVTDSSTQPLSVKLSDAALMRDWMSNKYKLSSLRTWSFDCFSLGSLRGPPFSPPASQAPVMARAIKHRSSSSLARARNFKTCSGFGKIRAVSDRGDGPLSRPLPPGHTTTVGAPGAGS